VGPGDCVFYGNSFIRGGVDSCPQVFCEGKGRVADVGGLGVFDCYGVGEDSFLRNGLGGGGDGEGDGAFFFVIRICVGV